MIKKTIKDFKRELTAVFTFGFCITGFFSIIHDYISNGIIDIDIRNITYISLSFLSMIIIGFFNKDKHIIHESIKVHYMMFCFTLLFIPILYFIDELIVGYKISNCIRFDICFIEYKRMIICYLISIILLLINNINYMKK